MSASGQFYDDIFEREWFKTWQNDLARIVRALGNNLDEKALQLLNDGLKKIYLRHSFPATSSFNVPVHEIAPSLARVIKFLKSVEGERNVIEALMHYTDTDYEDLFPAGERVSIIVAGLEAIAAIPSRRSTRGRPGNQNLYEVVHGVASLWEVTTGKTFTQQWNDREPISLGAQFPYAIVRRVSTADLAGLPKMTERVVAERRRGITEPLSKRTQSTFVK